ncbi:MAG: glucans biosynthesis glucosyltransferase MdoH [Ponticaulis sp.]|nr:glucans biosynthesis glucosyltransferase MdoH [Ponticaulis sp.]
MSGSRPPEVPLDMPEQPLAWKVRAPLKSDGRSRYWRKIILGGLSAALTLWLSWLMFRVLNVMGMTGLEWALLCLFVVNIGWICMAFVSGTAGLIVSLFGDRRRDVSEAGPSTGRTAIVFPIYNESVVDVFATVQATSQALSKAAPGQFECFILSDTVSPDIALQEEAGYLTLRKNAGEACPIYYRRRTINLARKSGNVHDFVSRWGGRYDHLIVFDADSYMSSDCILELVHRMEADPGVGLIQTVPQLIGAKSLFARAQEFAASVYGPVLGRGIAWWSGNEGNYWGHNAIIRTQAFAQAAGLPIMPGRAPLGGHILSHDFVEAALLRRAGWKVQIASDLGGSFEEGPQTIIDLTIRDRRWCQGNLQHTAVLARARGITLTNRLHFSIGIFSYLASPLWLVLILVGMALSLQNRFLKPEYFSGDPTLTPSWPVIDPALALSVFIATMSVLLLPKAYGVFVKLVRPGKGLKGRPVSLILGGLVETVISALVAPILMAAQTSSVLSILTGQDSGWTPQQRGSDGYKIRDVARRHAVTTVLGVVLTMTAWIISPIFAAWLAPATLGMILSIPLSWALGKEVSDDSFWAQLISRPLRSEAPDCFSEAVAARTVYETVVPPGLSQLVSDDQYQRAHADLVDPHWPLQGNAVHVPLAIAEAKLSRLPSLDAFLGALDKKETMALLNSPEVLKRASERFSGKVLTPV